MITDREVRKERTGFRDPDLLPWHRDHGFEYPVQDDLDFSGRHRKWGWNCPAVDVDFPFLEYDHCLPIAFIDYKLREGLQGEPPNKMAANNLTLSRLCVNDEQLPYYVIWYMKKPWMFRIFPINDKSEQIAPKKQILSEAEYVAWLYEIRGYTVEKYLASTLDNQIRWDSLLPVPRKSKRKTKSPYTLFDQTPILQQELEAQP